VKIPYIVETH